MSRSRSLGLVVSLLMMTMGAIAAHKALVHQDDYLYGEIVVIKGTVQEVHSEDGTSVPCAGQYLLFQRADCKRCLIATTTDMDGNYFIRVSRGKYRLIVREGNRIGETYDVIAPDQSRYLDATEDTQFDIKLRPSPFELQLTPPAN
jgi:hypothetical protein